MKKWTIEVMITLSVLSASAQKTFTVSGYVTDAVSDETLISATVLDLQSGLGTVTNA